MKSMRATRLLTVTCSLMAALCGPVFAACMYMPEHYFTLTVVECRGVTFESVGFKSNGNFELDSPGSEHSGTVLSGPTFNHSYNWGDMVARDDFEPWPEQSYRNVYLDQPAEEYCTLDSGVDLSLSEVKQCCDTPPFYGICLVRLPEVKLNEDDRPES